MWLVFAISAAIMWGFDYSLCEEIFKSKISPVSLLAFEMILGGLLLLPFVAFTRIKTDIHILSSNKYALVLFLAILITFNLGNLLIFLSIDAGKNATLAGLVELAYPIFTVLFTYYIFRENHITPSVIVGGCFIFLGIGIISYFNEA